MRVNLAVPFSEKEQAKKLGARWDFDGRTWYVENPDNLAPFLRWLKLDAPKAKRRKAKARPLARIEIRKGERITGRDYRPSCDCTVPPWESCACSALLASGSLAAELDERLELLLWKDAA